MKVQRQAAIAALVEREAIYSQELLRTRLQAQGFDVTQATLSRDMRDLGLVKRAADGAYQRPDAAAAGAPPGDAGAALKRRVREFLRSREQVQQLVVLKTEPGQASVLAIALDRASLPDIAGTIAGDDTILVIARDIRKAGVFMKQLAEWTA